MRTLAIAACALWMCVDCNAEASPSTDVIKTCAPYRDLIADAAEVEKVPFALLTALVFAESSCVASKVNRKGACGLGQVLLTGAGEGYTRDELLDPWTNLQVASAHLAKWKRRCGSWRGAVSIYNGSGRCSARTEFSAKVMYIWKGIVDFETRRS
jgi:soluble lytic murein transglycosylase-like protein